MSCDIGEVTERLENELCFRHFTYVTTHFPTLPSFYLRHSSFSNPSVASPTSQFILQPFFRFSYVISSLLNSPGEPPMLHTIKITILFNIQGLQAYSKIAPLGSRVRVLVTPCGFHSERIGVFVGFSRVSPVFLCNKFEFHNFSTPISLISFISSASVMVRQA